MKLLICLITLVLGFCVSAAAQGGLGASCSRAIANIDKIVCHDKELSQNRAKAERLMNYARRNLSKEVFLVLGQVVEQWYFNASYECGFDGLNATDKSNDSKKCLVQKFTLLDIELSRDLSKPAPKPYLLSSYELLVIAEESAGTFSGFDYDGDMRRVLHRLVLSVAGSKSNAVEFFKAISGPGPFAMPDRQRYVFGQACMKHYCNFERGAFIADTQTGGIVFAIEHENDLTIFEKACSNEALKAYAKQNFMAPWPSDESPSTSQTSNMGFIDPLSGPRTAEQTKIETTACR